VFLFVLKENKFVKHFLLLNTPRTRYILKSNKRLILKIYTMKNKIWISIIAVLSITVSTYSQCVSGDCDNGKGTYVWEDGEKYVGKFKNEEYHGSGILTKKDGTNLKGIFVKGEIWEGSGTYVDDEGKYIGEFKKGKYQGKGILISEDGRFKLEGTFIDGKFLEGTIVNPESGYTGEFSNGEYNGFGTQVYEDGSKYIGQFKDGDRHGKGKMVDVNGKATSGIYIKGRLDDGTNNFECSGDCENGQGTLSYYNGDKYIGQWKAGKKHGKGTFIYNGGEKYVGEFKNDEIHGYGIYRWPNGNVYKGNFVNNKKHGKGKTINADGTETNETYVKGNLKEEVYKLYFKNKCKYKLEILLRYKNTLGQWKTKGWFKLKPGEAGYLGNTKNEYAYYFAQDKTGKWTGSNKFFFKGRRYKFRKWKLGNEKGMRTKGLTCD
jgi:hypothetical protein